MRSAPTPTAHVDVQRLSPAALCDDIDRNIRRIAALTGMPEPASERSSLSFAYPYGVTALRAKAMLRRRFAGLRGIQPGVNAGIIDLAHLQAQELYDRTSDLAAIAALLDEAERSRGWLILYTHDVSTEPSPIGCSRAYFAQVVDLARRRRIDVRPVASVLGRHRRLTSVSAGRYRVDLRHGAAALDTVPQDTGPSAALRTPFQTRAWLATWYRAFCDGADHRPLIALVHDTDVDARTPAVERLVLVLPLVRRRRHGLPLVEYADRGITDYNLPILGPKGDTDAAAALDAVARAVRPYARLSLRKMPLSVSGTPNLLASVSHV